MSSRAAMFPPPDSPDGPATPAPASDPLTHPTAPTADPTAGAPDLRRAIHPLRRELERRAGASRLPGAPLAPFWSVQPAWAATRRLAAGAEPSDPLRGLLGHLHEVVVRQVRAMRDEGARPEQMLVRMKAFVREAMAAEGWQDADSIDALTTHVVGWSIDAYYDR